MDRNSIIGFVLIAAILFGYTWYSMPSAEEAARMKREQDSLATLELEEQARRAAAELPTATSSRGQHHAAFRHPRRLGGQCQCR
jgi:YidC/Oxa1 family membrane protein insertase